MKARNTKTGEVVDNFGFSKEYGTVSYTDKNGILTVSTAASGEWEIIGGQEDCVDWSAFRREAAKDILTGIVSSGNYQECNGKERVRIAIDYANALIEKLKEDKK